MTPFLNSLLQKCYDVVLCKCKFFKKKKTPKTFVCVENNIQYISVAEHCHCMYVYLRKISIISFMLYGKT